MKSSICLKMDEQRKEKEIDVLREYLKIPCSYPCLNYDPLEGFLKKQAERLGIPVKIFNPGNVGKPIILFTWKGTDVNLPSILLCTQMDVAPAFEEEWSHPPFGAEIDHDGKIFARGAQQMKSLGMLHLAAIYGLKKQETQLKRTIHVLFAPDEDSKDILGIETFVLTKEFKDLNVGFVLGPGTVSSNEEFYISYAERSLWKVQFHVNGCKGHSCLLMGNTAEEKMRILFEEIQKFRFAEMKKLKKDCSLHVGDVTTINLTMISGGVNQNIIPNYLTATYDINLAINDHACFQEKLEEWCKLAGENVTIMFLVKNDQVPPTTLNDTNPYWLILEKTLQNLNLTYEMSIRLESSCNRFFREMLIPTVGFTPFNCTPFHEYKNDEYIQKDTYLKGIEIFEDIISNLGNFSFL